MVKRLIGGFVLLVLLGAAYPTHIATAQRPDAPTYAQWGSYSVGTRDLQIEDETRPLNITVWYPALNPDNAEESTVYTEGLLSVSGDAIRDAEIDPSGGTYPLVLFSHGNGGLRVQSLYFTERLASYGFIVLSADHPDDTLFDAITGGITDEALIESFALRPFDMLRMIDYADTLNAADGLLEGLIDMDHIGVSGHSFGGYTALSVGGARLDFSANPDSCTGSPDDSETCALLDYADEVAALRGIESAPDGLWDTTTDPRVQAVVAMAPLSSVFTDAGIATIQIPTLLVVGSGDRVLPIEDNAAATYEALTTDTRALVTLENGGHYLFVTECSRFAPFLLDFGLSSKCSDEVWDMERAHDIVDHFSIAFLLHALKGDETALAALRTETEFLGVDYVAELP